MRGFSAPLRAANLARPKQIVLPMPTAPEKTPLLQMEGVYKHFGPTQALKNVSFEVPPGSVTALIGENGAGKSTLMKVLAGALAADSGNMRLDNRAYEPRGPQDARAAGVAMIYQELNLAPDLTVEDNIMLGVEQRRFGMVRHRRQREQARQALARLDRADISLDARVGWLSVGAQQLVEIARALVLDVKLIVFDEPTSSLTRHDALRLFEVIRNLQSGGMGVVYISHFLEEVREICDRYVVLRDGEVAGAGGMRGVSEAEIVSLMVGRDVADLFPSIAHTPGETLLAIENVSGRTIPQRVDLELRRGEILGISGLVGAGRTELLRTLFGLAPISAGVVRLHGRAIKPKVCRMIRAGVGMVSEDRKTEGLAQDRSIADNMTYSRLAPYARWGWLSLGKREKAVLRWMQRMQIKAAGAGQAVSSLSGGNQQKVAVARLLHQEADVYLLDEPTRGIDVGAKSEIYRLMGELAAQGKSVIFVSSYLPELLAVCDRVSVMARGEVCETRAAADWTEEEIMLRAVRAAELS